MYKTHHFTNKSIDLLKRLWKLQDLHLAPSMEIKMVLTPQGIICAGMHMLCFAGKHNNKDVFPCPWKASVKILD